MQNCSRLEETRHDTINNTNEAARPRYNLAKIAVFFNSKKRLNKILNLCNIRIVFNTYQKKNLHV